MAWTSDTVARWFTSPAHGAIALRHKTTTRRLHRNIASGCVAGSVVGSVLLETRSTRVVAKRGYTQWTPTAIPRHTNRRSVVVFSQGSRSAKDTSSPSSSPENGNRKVPGSFVATLAAVAQEDSRGNASGSTKTKDTESKPKPKPKPNAKSAGETPSGTAQTKDKPKKRRPKKKAAPNQNPKGTDQSSKNSNMHSSSPCFDDDGGWRKRSKQKLQSDINRYVDVASAAIEFERRNEANGAAAMSSMKIQSEPNETTATPEGTVIGRLGASMDGVHLTSARPNSGKNGRLLNLRAGGGELPPSALAVGDRVACVFTGNAVDKSMMSFDEPSTAPYETLSDQEAVITELDPIGGVVTLLEAKPEGKGLDKTKSLNEMLAGRKLLEEIIAGRVVRLVRVPDATTYERQLTALRTLRNVPTSRTKPPSMLVVKALFSQNRCPPFDQEIDAGISVGDRLNAHTQDECVDDIAGHFGNAPDVQNVDGPIKRLAANDLPELNFEAVTRGGGGALPHGFDDAQSLAVRAALCTTTPVCWIQGPPGTGKTKVVVEIIRRAVRSGQRVLACAPSNAAVDNLVERLAEVADSSDENGDSVEPIKFVRIGAPERISDAALLNSLEARVRDATKGYFDQGRNTRRRELVAATRLGFEKRDEMMSKKIKNKKALDAKISSLRKEQRTMAVSGRKTRAKAERDVLQNANVVLSTTVGAGAENIQKLPAFDLLVLDEAAQATEPSSWIPLVRAKRVVFVGDPQQLAPLVRSEEAMRVGLATPIMTRVALPQQKREVKELDDSNTTNPSALLSSGVLGCALGTQYRSHAHISDWASRESYNGRLYASPSVATGLLRDLPGVVATRATSSALLLLDTRVADGSLLGGCGEVTERELLASLSDYGSFQSDSANENSSKNYSSLVNEGEAYAVTMHVAGLLRAGLAPSAIAVQSPYAAQVRLMQRRLREAARIGLAVGAELVEVASVDSFQGREAEAVVVSTVRSNNRNAVGFLSDARRTNVAVTRARRHVAIVGDSSTVGSDMFLAKLLSHIRENGVASPADEHKELHEPL